VLDIIPYRKDKNLGLAYNEAFRQTQAEVICFRDGDTMFLTPDYGNILDEYYEQNKNAVLVCYINRASPLSTGQLYGGKVNSNPNILAHIHLAEKQKRELYTVTEVNQDISGTLMVVPRSIWEVHPFKGRWFACLGQDTEWNRRIRAAGVKILLMNGLYIWHTYRLQNGIYSKKHLLNEV
jgi:GT2 family glycosyltransferase